MKESCCAGDTGTDVAVRDAISMLLFDYVVEDKADAIAAGFGIERLR